MYSTGFNKGYSPSYTSTVSGVGPSPILPILVGFTLSTTQFINLYNPIVESPQNSILLANKSLRYLLVHIRFSTPFYMTPLTELFSYEVRGTLGSDNLLTTPNKLTQGLKNFPTLYTHLVSNVVTWSGRYSKIYLLILQSYGLQTGLNLLQLLLLKNTSITSPIQGVIVYQFHKISSLERIFVFTPLQKKQAEVNSFSSELTTTTSQWGVSVAQLFSCARWLEREASELFGIQLLGMVDKRNLLLQYGETSAPLKKSYPSVGWYEVYYVPIYNSLVERFISHTE